MTDLALILVLIAALLHASWNAMVKAAGDRALVLACIAAANTVAGASLIALFGVPALESWAFVAASALLHYVYYWFLFQAYRFGDLSQVYPIARGSAPLLVALGAQLFAGEVLPWLAWAGIWTVSAGIGLLSLSSRASRTADPRAVLAAFATGFLIACYSVVDGMGVRLSGNPFAYIGWLFATEAAVVAVIAYRRRGQWRHLALPAVRYMVLGASAVVAYALAIYANLLAAMGTVSAVREVSVVIAALIGVIVFRERPWRVRLIAAAIVAAGVVILALSGAQRA